jgi:hypothetical protein
VWVGTFCLSGDVKCRRGRFVTALNRKDITEWGDIEIIKRDHKENKYISDLCTVKHLCR